MEKAVLRQQMAADRRALPIIERRRLDTKILKTLLGRKEIRAAKTICTYVSLPEEVDTREFIKLLLKEGKHVIVPIAEGHQLVLYRIKSQDDLVPGAFGILEPKAMLRRINASMIDVFIIPGIAFGRARYRLGWGKGYYDRLLASVTAPKIGLAYSLQIVPRLDHAKYDIPMDTVITEHETYSP